MAPFGQGKGSLFLFLQKTRPVGLPFWKEAPRIIPSAGGPFSFGPSGRFLLPPAAQNGNLWTIGGSPGLSCFCWLLEKQSRRFWGRGACVCVRESSEKVLENRKTSLLGVSQQERKAGPGGFPPLPSGPGEGHPQVTFGEHCLDNCHSSKCPPRG